MRALCSPSLIDCFCRGANARSRVLGDGGYPSSSFLTALNRQRQNRPKSNDLTRKTLPFERLIDARIRGGPEQAFLNKTFHEFLAKEITSVSWLPLAP